LRDSSIFNLINDNILLSESLCSNYAGNFKEYIVIFRVLAVSQKVVLSTELGVKVAIMQLRNLFHENCVEEGKREVTRG
jgi:hypothetical protein